MSVSPSHASNSSMAAVKARSSSPPSASCRAPRSGPTRPASSRPTAAAGSARPVRPAARSRTSELPSALRRIGVPARLGAAKPLVPPASGAGREVPGPSPPRPARTPTCPAAATESATGDRPRALSYGAGVAAPNHVARARGSSGSVRPPAQATCPSGRINTADGPATSPKTGSSHTPSCLASTDPCVRPRSDVEAAGGAQVEEHGPGVLQQREDARGAVRGRRRGRACAARAVGVPRRGRSGCRERRSSRRCAGAARPCPTGRARCRGAPGCARRCA